MTIDVALTTNTIIKKYINNKRNNEKNVTTTNTTTKNATTTNTTMKKMTLMWDLHILHTVPRSGGTRLLLPVLRRKRRTTVTSVGEDHEEGEGD